MYNTISHWNENSLQARSNRRIQTFHWKHGPDTLCVQETHSHGEFLVFIALADELSYVLLYSYYIFYMYNTISHWNENSLQARLNRRIQTFHWKHGPDTLCVQETYSNPNKDFRLKW